MKTFRLHYSRQKVALRGHYLFSHQTAIAVGSCYFVFVVIGWLLLAGLDGAAWPITQGTTSSGAQESAIKLIPFDKLQPDAARKVQSVLEEACFFRRLPVCVIPCDPELYCFLTRHPDVIVAVWQLMGITQLDCHQIGPGRFRFVDGAGTHGTIEYLYSNHDTHIIYTEGLYEGSLFIRPVKSRGVIVLKSGFVRETDGQYYVTSRLDAFLSVDRAAIEALTKTFHPLVGRVADTNFSQTAHFVGMLSRTAQENPDGLRRLAERLQGVQPEVKQQFATILAQVAEKAEKDGRNTGPRRSPENLAERVPDTSRK